MNSVKNFVIIVAGGTGSRMNSDVPKQLLMLAGKPVIIHTIERFLSFDPYIECVIVLHSSLIDTFRELVKQFSLSSSSFRIVEGGPTCFHSVKNGLSAIMNEKGIVGIHDAARPLVSTDTLNRTYQTALKTGNAVPCVPLAESIREITDEKNRAVNRSNYRIVQTPQCFDLDLLRPAFSRDYENDFSDDATVFERAGHTINLVEGNPENIKITLPSDLLTAEALLQQLK